MTTYTITPNSTLEVKEAIINDFGMPIIPSSLFGPPQVNLYDKEKNIVSRTLAVPGSDPGEWLASLPIPDMNITEAQVFRLVWKLVDSDGNRQIIRDTVYVEPTKARREGEIVILNTNPDFMLIAPFLLDTAHDEVNFSIYQDNTLVVDKLPYQDTTVKHKINGTVTRFILPVGEWSTSLTPYLLLLSHSFADAHNEYPFRLFVVTPSVIKATLAVEDFINKARLANIIPELDYRQSDLLLYLERGLNMFNSLPPLITGFTGLNMKGTLHDCWLICASYYALMAQLQAEGALAFDFSGQSVTLNVDRTPTIESTLGRLEQQIEQMVKPFKKLLVKSGVTAGDGSITGTLGFGKNFGVTSLINAPTTRWGLGSRFTAFPMNRGFFP